VQALTPTLFPCYRAADRETAAAIAGFLERGADVRVLLEDGAMRPGEDLVQKSREARMADIVLVLFSRNSLPSPWPRSQWEGAMQKEPAEENVRIAFVKCDDCAPPRVLSPQFDLTVAPPSGLRRLKRWLRAGNWSQPEKGSPEMEALGAAIADQPGMATVDRAGLAAEFANAFQDDFDAVLRLECGGRTPTALAGDLATQLGLRLEGSLDDNLARLGDFCATRRFLLVLFDPAHPFVPGGRCSTLVSTEAGADAPPRDESLRAIQYRLLHPRAEADWGELCRLARAGLRLAGEQGRVAEQFELLRQWQALAKARADRRILEETARGTVWILEGWDRVEEAQRLEYHRALEYDEQMGLDFGKP
jgi:hypothetical protein